jgi:thymidylate kinase
LLTINPETVINNRSDSIHDHSADLEWQKLKQSRYDELLKGVPTEFCVIDGTLPSEEITKVILNKVLSELS